MSNTLSFGILSGLQPTEEERKKKRDQFNNNVSNLGFGNKSNQGDIFGGGKLSQQIQQEQKQGGLTRTPAQARLQEAGQEQQRQRAQQRAQTEADRQQRARDFAIVKQEAQAVARMLVKEQAKAVEQLKAKAQAKAQGNPVPQAASPEQRPIPVIAPPVVKPNLNLGLTSPPQKQPSPMLGMVGNPNTGKPLSNNISDKTIADEDKAKSGNYDDIGTIGSEPIWTGNPDNKSFGLSITPTPDRDPIADFAKSTETAQPNLGFNIPRAPMRSWSERQERDSLLRDTSTAYKGSQNGQLTANQMELRAGILGADDKYKNDQYTSQLGAASQVAQTQATQAGANARAALSEVGSNNRLDTQIGFDVNKFQKTASQQDQQLGLDSRRLDVDEANNEVQNLGTKSMNNLYEKYQSAKTDDQKSEIAAQIRDLKGTASDSENWTNIGGGEALSADGLTSTKNPDILLNRSTGETKEIPKAPVDYIRDPRAIAILSNRALSDNEMHAQLMALF